MDALIDRNLTWNMFLNVPKILNLLGDCVVKPSLFILELALKNRVRGPTHQRLDLEFRGFFHFEKTKKHTDDAQMCRRHQVEAGGRLQLFH